MVEDIEEEEVHLQEEQEEATIKEEITDSQVLDLEVEEVEEDFEENDLVMAILNMVMEVITTNHYEVVLEVEEVVEKVKVDKEEVHKTKMKLSKVILENVRIFVL